MPGPSLSGQTTTLRAPSLISACVSSTRHLPAPSALVVASRPSPPAVLTSFSPSTISRGVVRIRGEDAGDCRQIEQERHSVGSAARPLFGGLVPHFAAETLLSRFRDVSGLGPGIASVEVLIGIADLFVRTVAADMRSRQAAFFDQVVADGLKMLGVAVLRPAVKQDAAPVGDRQQQRRIVRAARLVNRAAAQDAAVAFDRAADRLGDVLCGDVSDIHGRPSG